MAEALNLKGFLTPDWDLSQSGNEIPRRYAYLLAVKPCPALG